MYILSAQAHSQGAQQQKWNFRTNFLVNFRTISEHIYGIKNLNKYKFITSYLAQISHKHERSSHSLQYYE